MNCFPYTSLTCLNLVVRVFDSMTFLDFSYPGMICWFLWTVPSGKLSCTFSWWKSGISCLFCCPFFFYLLLIGCTNIELWVSFPLNSSSILHSTYFYVSYFFFKRDMELLLHHSQSLLLLLSFPPSSSVLMFELDNVLWPSSPALCSLFLPGFYFVPHHYIRRGQCSLHAHLVLN